MPNISEVYISLPFSGSKSKPSKKTTEICSKAYSSALKMEVICSSRISDFLQTTEHYNSSFLESFSVAP
jgi:hypothetical protein